MSQTFDKSLRGSFADISSRASIPFGLITNHTVATNSSFLLFIQMIVGILIYYLPFYFQVVHGTNAWDLVVQNLPFLITLLFAPMLSGTILIFVGVYIPFMWFGACTATIGSGLLFTLHRGSGQSAVAGYQFMAGLGLGSCNQLPYSAIQHKLPPSLLVMSSTIVSFCNSLGPVLGTNIAQAIFTSSLQRHLRSIPQIDPIAIIHGGPTNIGTIVEPSFQSTVRDSSAKESGTKPGQVIWQDDDLHRDMAICKGM